MAERVATLGALLAAKLLAKKYLKRKKKEEEKKEEKPAHPKEESEFLSKTSYFRHRLKKELGYTPSYSRPLDRMHAERPWGWPIDAHPQFAKLENWIDYAKRRRWIVASEEESPDVGNLLSLLIMPGTTAIILTKDGRLFLLPQGKDDLETVTNIWEPLFNYLETKAAEIASKENIPFKEALKKVVQKLGLQSKFSTDPRGIIEGAALHPKEDPENRKRFLLFLKKVYIDELGLDWMPLPLVNIEYGYIPVNETYLQELPRFLKEELGLNPEDPIIKKRLQALRKLIYETHWPQYWQIRQALALIEALHREKKIDDEKYNRYLDLLIQGKHTELIREAEKLAQQVAGEEGEEESVAAKLMARVIEERLPGVGYRVASLLHALEKERLKPETILEYMNLLHSPTSPHGTALYNLIHHLINHYEKKVKEGEEIPPPSEAIKEIITALGDLYTDPKQVLREAEEQRIHPEWINTKINLGIPLPPSKAARSVRNFIEALERLEKGEDPEELDTKLELTILAKTLKTEPHPEGPGDLKKRTLNPYLWQRVFDQVMEEYFNKAHQLGREEEAKLLREMSHLVKEHLARVDKSNPYYKVIAQTMKQVMKKLQEKGYSYHDAAWAVNVAQHILLTLPFHAARHPGDEPRVKALLLEGFTPVEHEIPPVLWGIHGFYRRIKEAKTREEKEALLARMRDTINTLEAIGASTHRTIETLKKEKELTPRKIGEAFYHATRPISRVIR